MLTHRNPPQEDSPILLLEDWNESLESYQRMLARPTSTAIMKQARAIICGQMRGPEDAPTVGFRPKLRTLLLKTFTPLGIPVIVNAPFGHGAYNYPLPLGAHATLCAEKGRTPSLTLDGPAVRL